MSNFGKYASAVMLGTALIAVGACNQQTSTKDEEGAIRAQNAKWLDAIARHDANAVAQLYAADGEFLPPNSPKVTGRDAVKAAWEKMFTIPGVGLTFTTDRMVVGTGADLAVDIGNYDYESESGGSSVSDKGKSVVTWTKQNGQWLVLTDMFSSDAQMLPPTPTVPAVTGAATMPGPTNAIAPGTPGTTTTVTTTPPADATTTTPPATTTVTTTPPAGTAAPATTTTTAPTTPPAH